MKKFLLGVVGSRAYSNRDRVLKVISRYIERYGAENLVVVSGGCPNGGDAMAKDVALSLGLYYSEFPPKHARHNEYCVNPPDEYNKPYNVRNFFERNTQIAEYCDHVVAFIVKGVKANGTMDTIAKAKHFNKKVVVLED